LPTPGVCVETTIDFDSAADGTSLSPSTFVEKQWAAFGVTLPRSGGFGDLPHLLHTVNPGSQLTCVDDDLGASNEACRPSDPGICIGGQPNTPGENCEPLGNVLIIQEPGGDCPDNVMGV
jgi:hypothetical protein